jgi:hypothetical protein
MVVCHTYVFVTTAKNNMTDKYPSNSLQQQQQNIKKIS